VIEQALTQSELLSIWERGEGQRPSGRALALLSTVADDEPSPASLPVGRRDAALLELRVQLFGDAFSGLTTCPACGEDVELSFDASEVVRNVHNDVDPVLRIDGHEIALHAPTTADLASIESMTDLDAARVALLAKCIAPVDPATLSAEALDGVLARLEALDPQADVAIELECPECSHAWREPFDIATFFWTEVAVAAKRLLGEVHELASAYSWSERDILNLSPARRAAYLELVR
jgi:hypothetical protein